MSLNDKDITLVGARGVDVYPGVANPTTSSTNADPLASKFVTDKLTDVRGGGAPGNFTDHEDAARNFKQTAGVVEGHPGIIESTHIDPLNENSNKDDGWANVRPTHTGANATSSSAGGALNMATNLASGAAGVAASTARLAYGHTTANESAKQAAKEAVWGKQ